MPWTCSDCATTVTDDQSVCPACNAEKSAWTMIADVTREFVVAASSRLTVLRGDQEESFPPGDPAHGAATFTAAEVASVLSMTHARQLARRGHQPPSRHLLFARVTKPKPDAEVNLSVDFAQQELAIHPFTPASAVTAADGAALFTFLLVAGAGDAGDIAFPNVLVIDVTEETTAGFAPDVEIGYRSALVELPTERVPTPVAPVRVIPGGCFAFDSAFPSAGVAEVLRDAAGAVEEEDEQGTLQQIALFGHTDPAGSDAYNKKLSDRRAQAVRALLLSDRGLFDAVAAADGWGPAVYQAILRGLGCDPGPIDGEPGTMTGAAVRSFVRHYRRLIFHPDSERPPAHDSLQATSELSPVIEAALRDAYVTEYGVELDPASFVGPAQDPPCAGCSEFNPGPAEQEARRRVTLAVFGREAAPAPADFPCQAGDHGACALDGADARQRCAFYRDLVGPEEPVEPEVLTPFYDYAWLRTPSGKVHLSCVTPLPDSDALQVTVQRWTRDAPPREIDSNGPGDVPPDVGPTLATVGGWIRHGVASAIWDPGDVSPFRPREWFLPGEDAEGRPVERFAPPVFRVEEGPHWGISSAPGWRLDGTRFADPAFSGPFVALRNDLRVGGLEEPARQCVFARWCPSQADQLEQRASTEDIHVLGVRMGGIAESLSRLTRSCPAILEPGEPALIERDGSLSATSPLDHAIVDDQQGEEEDRDSAEPACADDLAAEREPANSEPRREDRKAKTRQPAVVSAPAFSLAGVFVAAPSIDLARFAIARLVLARARGLLRRCSRRSLDRGASAVVAHEPPKNSAPRPAENADSIPIAT